MNLGFLKAEHGLLSGLCKLKTYMDTLFFFWQMQNIVDRLKHKKICKWWNNSWFNIERILHNCSWIGSFKSWVSDKNKDMILSTKFKVNIYGTWHFVLRCSTRIKYQKAMSERQPGCNPDKRFPYKNEDLTLRSKFKVEGHHPCLELIYPHVKYQKVMSKPFVARP